MKRRGMNSWIVGGIWVIFSVTTLSLLFWDLPLTTGLILGSKPDPERPGHLVSLSPSLPWFWAKIAVFVTCLGSLFCHYVTRKR